MRSREWKKRRKAYLDEGGGGWVSTSSSRVDERGTLKGNVDTLATRDGVALSSTASGVIAGEQGETHVLRRRLEW